MRKALEPLPGVEEKSTGITCVLKIVSFSVDDPASFRIDQIVEKMQAIGFTVSDYRLGAELR